MSFKRSETIALKLDLRHYWELSWMIKLPNFFLLLLFAPSVSLNISSPQSPCMIYTMWSEEHSGTH